MFVERACREFGGSLYDASPFVKNYFQKKHFLTFALKGFIIPPHETQYTKTGKRAQEAESIHVGVFKEIQVDGQHLLQDAVIPIHHPEDPDTDSKGIADRPEGLAPEIRLCLKTNF